MAIRTHCNQQICCVRSRFVGISHVKTHRQVSSPENKSPTTSRVAMLELEEPYCTKHLQQLDQVAATATTIEDRKIDAVNSCYIPNTRADSMRRSKRAESTYVALSHNMLCCGACDTYTQEHGDGQSGWTVCETHKDPEQEEWWWDPSGLMLILGVRSIGSMLSAYSTEAPICIKQIAAVMYAYAIVTITPWSLKPVWHTAICQLLSMTCECQIRTAFVSVI